MNNIIKKILRLKWLILAFIFSASILYWRIDKINMVLSIIFCIDAGALYYIDNYWMIKEVNDIT